MNKIIEVTQKPIIAYSLLQKISNEVAEKIQSLNIDTLEPTNENLSIIKSTRAELKKEFTTLEEQRKMVKEIVLKDYNLFEDEYKKLISSPFKDADSKLKSLADTVDGRILLAKIDGIKSYFDEQNTFDFIEFEDASLKIIKSKSDKSIKAEIGTFLGGIATSIQTIQTLENKDRILAKFHIFKDFNRAISETNIEIEREKKIKLQNEAPKKIEIVPEKVEPPVPPITEPVVAIQVPVVDDKIYKASFSVFATKAQIKELKLIMEEKGIRYE